MNGRLPLAMEQDVTLATIANLFRVSIRDVDGEAHEAAFSVDGVPVTVLPRGSRGVRMQCVISGSMPADERALRSLLGEYLGACEHAEGVMCAGDDGALLLLTDIDADDDGDASVAVRAAAFCDAAIHWSRACARHAEQASLDFRHLTMIRP